MSRHHCINNTHNSAIAPGGCAIRFKNGTVENRTNENSASIDTIEW